MTTSLELSKALKEAGWKNEVEFYWYGDDLYFRNEMKDFCETCEARTLGMYITERKRFTAPTAEEILEKLPKEIVNHFGDNERQGLMIGREEYGWTVYYNHCSNLSRCMDVEAETLADACAKMWLYLKSHNLLPQ